MLLCNSGHVFYFEAKKKTEFGILGYQECFFSASSTRSVGFPTPARFTVIFWSLPLPLKEWYLDFVEIQGVDLREVCEIHISGQWGFARNNPLDKLRFIRFSLA